MARLSFCIGVVALVAVTGLGDARADEQAESLYADGKAALAEERYEDAATAFATGLDRVASGPARWRLQIGLALAHEGRGDLVGAAALYRAFLRDSVAAVDEESDKWTERRAAIADDVTALDHRLAATHARLDLQSEPSGAAVSVTGVTLPAGIRTPVVVHLAPGSHRITLEHPDRVPVTFSVFLERGQRTLLHKELEPPSTVAALDAPPPPTTPLRPVPTSAAPAVVPEQPRTPREDGLTPAQIAGVAGMGAGAVALLTGVGLTVATGSAVSELEELQTVPVTDEVRARDRDLRERVPTLEAASVAMYVTGGVLGVAGTFMLVLGGRNDPSSSWRLSPDGVGVRF